MNVFNQPITGVRVSILPHIMSLHLAKDSLANERLTVIAYVLGLYCEQKGFTDSDYPLVTAIEQLESDLNLIRKHTGMIRPLI